MPAEISERSILVVDSRPDVGVALRDRVDPRRALVLRHAPTELDDVLATVTPFPFALVGVTRGAAPSTVPGCLASLIAARPVIVLWYGPPPPGLPVRALTVERLPDLQEALEDIVDTDLGGLTLADRRGTHWVDDIVDCVELESLIACPDATWTLSSDALARVRAAIAQHQLPLTVAGDGRGDVRLRLAGCATP